MYLNFQCQTTTVETADGLETEMFILLQNQINVSQRIESAKAIITTLVMVGVPV